MRLNPNNLKLFGQSEERGLKMALSKTIAALSLMALGLTGCATVAPEAIKTTPLVVTTNGSAATESEQVINSPAQAEAENGAEASSQVASPVEVEAAPDGGSIDQNMTDEDLLWEALMGPDGEYAAAASYQAVLDRFGTVEPYASILEAELRHIAALTRQLERLGVNVPSNPYLSKVAAPSDLESAATAWATGEILNVEMYDALISQANDAQVIKVLGNLRRSSLESHLPAFEQAAASGGVLDEFQSGH
jgi:hypothetical protein